MSGPLLRAVPLPHLHGATVVAMLRGGPRYEGPRQGGLTHFLEHMLFRGAGPWAGAADLLGAFEELGDEPEAYTCDDSLVVAFETAPDALPRALELLATVLTRPRYADLDHERELILEERLERVDAQGAPIDLDDLARALVFPGQPLGRSILGSEAEIRATTRAALEQHRRQLVRAGNLVVVAAGAVDEAALRAAAGPLEAIPSGPALQDRGRLESPPGPRTCLAPLLGAAQVELRFSFLAPGQADPAWPALALLVDLLDGGSTSRLPQRLVDTGLCYHARADLVPFPELSLLEVELAVSRDKAAEGVARALGLLGEVGLGVETAELERAARRRGHRRRKDQDDPRHQAEWLARRALFGLPLDPAGEEARAAQVGAEEVAALARAVFRPERLSAVMLGSPTRAQRRGARAALERWCAGAAGGGA